MHSYAWSLIVLMWVVGLPVFAGCGGQVSSRKSLELIVRDNQLSEEEKLELVAKKIFSLEGVIISPIADQGNRVSLLVQGNDDSIVQQTLKGKEAAKFKAAIKEFHLKTMIKQLGNYVHYMRGHHLQELDVTLRTSTFTDGETDGNWKEAYRLVIKADKFDAFEAAANLRPTESIPKCEKLWQTIVDSF